jgi:hypothetical protein
MSQASDGKEALGGRQPTFRFQVVFLISFLLLSNIQKYKKIFLLKRTEEENFLFSNTVQIVTRFGPNVTRFAPPLKLLSEIFLSKKRVPFDISRNVSRC